LAKVFVSVLIDTYNHERFIEEAITSVLEQDFPSSDREVLVVDDGSTDRTAEIVRKFAPRVRLIQKSNGGQGSAFNTGIPECRGEVTAFLDGDDWWYRNKLSVVIPRMAADPSVGMVGHSFVETFPGGEEKIVALGHEARFRLNSVKNAEAFRLCRCYLGTSRLAMRTAIARRALTVPEELSFEADEYIFTVGATLADVLILNDPLCHYRIHGGNLFITSGATPNGTRRKQKVLAALGTSLSRELALLGTPTEVSRCVLEIIEAEEAQLRLMLDGGTGWETYRTENLLYRVQHADASWTHRLFRYATMIPAIFLPPVWFYKARRWIGNQSWYRRARKKMLPAPEFSKIPVGKAGDE